VVDRGSLYHLIDNNVICTPHVWLHIDLNSKLIAWVECSVYESTLVQKLKYRKLQCTW